MKWDKSDGRHWIYNIWCTLFHKLKGRYCKMRALYVLVSMRKEDERED